MSHSAPGFVPRAICPRFFASALFLIALFSACQAADSAPNLITSVAWHDNLTNADRRPDILGALALDADLSFTHRRGLTPRDSLQLTSHLAGENLPRFDDLSRATLGAALAWQRKFGLGPEAPILSAALSGDVIFAHDSDARALAGAIAVMWRQRLDDSNVLRLTQNFSRSDARGAVYDRTAAETSLDLTHTLNENWQFGAVARLRFGDVLSFGTPPRPDLVALARVRTPEDTFDRPMIAYSFTARTLSGGLSLARLLDARTSLTFATEYRSTEKSALRYVNRLVSATLAHQF